MIVQTIHEIQNPFDAFAKGLGHCLAMFMFAGSSTSNPQFLVKTYITGDLRVVDQNDLKVYGNPAAGEPLTPYIPEEWRPKSTNVPKNLRHLKNHKKIKK